MTWTEHTRSFHVSSPRPVPGVFQVLCRSDLLRRSPEPKKWFESILFLELRKLKPRRAKLPVKGRTPWWDFTADLTAPSALVGPGAGRMKAGEVPEGVMKRTMPFIQLRFISRGNPTHLKGTLMSGQNLSRCCRRVSPDMSPRGFLKVAQCMYPSSTSPGGVGGPERDRNPRLSPWLMSRS